ncbi:MAG: DUF4435 domain-containing protein [Chloroflexota bacterium]
MTNPTRSRSTLEVIQAIRDGSTCAILVEGEEKASDAWMLRHILKDKISQEITFHGRDGRSNLLAELPTFIDQLPTGKVAAIVDRDFTGDDEVERTYSTDYSGHVFYWRRYCIENYLLEPELVSRCVNMAHSQHPESVPPALSTTETVEKYLLEWCKRLAPQVAGNWSIHELTQETDKQGLNVEARSYFKDVTDRDSARVLSELTRKYAGWSKEYPTLFGENSLRSRFTGKLKQVNEKVETLSGAHQVVDGKRFLKPALNRLLPSSLRPYFFSLLAELASQDPPLDIRALVEERILPRWRRARAE